MRSPMFVILCLFSLIYLLPGCAVVKDDTVSEPVTGKGKNMLVSVDFREVHLCSRISPEITVENAPRGTKFYDVSLIELNNPGIFLGGGRRDEDGSGLIPEGALTRQYTGPCPEKDRKIEYAYVVSAMESDSGEPLEVATCRFIPN